VERFDPAAERGLLVVLPHPDDESFSTGGTLALCSDAGVPALYLCATYGDMGRRMGIPARNAPLSGGTVGMVDKRKPGCAYAFSPA